MAKGKGIAPVLHSIKINGTTNSILLYDEYESIGSVLGIQKITDGTVVGEKVTVGELIKNGRAVHIRCGVGTVGKLKYVNVLCPIDKVASAMGGLHGKSITGKGDIRTTGFRRRRIRR